MFVQEGHVNVAPFWKTRQRIARMADCFETGGGLERLYRIWALIL